MRSRQQYTQGQGHTMSIIPWFAPQYNKHFERGKTMNKNVTKEQAHLIERCLTMDDCKFAFVGMCIEKIMAGVDMPNPEKEPEKVKAMWEAFKAEWEKEQAERRETNG